MRGFLAYNAFQWYGLLDRFLDQTEKPAGKRISRNHAKNILGSLTIWFGEDGAELESMGWEEAGSRVWGLMILLDCKKGKKPPTYERVHVALWELQMAILNELAEGKFAYIPKEKKKYFERTDLFGAKVKSVTSKGTREEIKQAGSCLAAELYTAAVFHLMRVAELGLRALARELSKRKKGQKALEYVTLDNLIKLLEGAITEKLQKLEGIPNSRKKDADLTLFRGLLVDARFFKDSARNPISHVRKTYNEEDAISVFQHVEDFLQRLAPRISNNNKI